MARDRERYRRSRSRSRSGSPSRKRRDRDRKSRSRDRDRDRDKERYRRSRSRDRDRKDRDRKRRRSRSGSVDRRRRTRSRSRSRGRDKKDLKKEVKDEKKDSESFDFAMLDKDAEQERLEQEMKKRRDRIEKWRAERKKKEADAFRKEVERGTLMDGLKIPSKKWSLEDDDEEEEEPAAAKQDEEDEVDPLDAYMQDVQAEARKLTRAVQPKDKKGPGVVVISGVAKKAEAKKKGEVMEQNQDALEYSSEEERDESELEKIASGLQAKKKELPKIDHQNVDYIPFRKKFYVEVPEISRMTAEEVEEYRTELEGIKVKGKDCPKPIKTWAQCGVSKKVLDVLKRHGYEKPTPIQAQAIPAIMSGRDMIGIAKTGSGKTLAFLLPLFRHVIDQPSLEEGDGPIALVMAPTRELCLQIGKECKKFTKSIGLNAVCVYGGTGISEQIAELKRGAEIIVCTPGRMIEILAANNGRVTNLKRVTYIVLDEADRMFDMGFEPQVMRIVDNTRPDRQTVLFSATFPRQMEALARHILHTPLEIVVGGRSVVAKEVVQHVLVVEDEKKFIKLLEILGLYAEQGSAIIFVDKQEAADDLLKDLMKAGYDCIALHGGVDQYDRDSAITDFKSGKVKLMVATSVAARGLDVKQLILVVNFDCPNHYEDYVHRCGRTGRAGNRGYAYTFLQPDQGRNAGDIIKALELSGSPVPEELQQLWNDYKTKQESEGKKVKTGGGFSGKGFRFDDEEAKAAKSKKDIQKAALGLQDSDDEDIESNIDKEIDKLMVMKKTVHEIKTGVPVGQLPPGVPASVLIGAAAKPAADKLELAKKLASKITLTKQETPVLQPPKEAFQPPGNPALISSKSVAAQIAARLNTKLNYVPREGESEENEDGEVTVNKIEVEIEINDFPQQARWKVTSREALAQIAEYSEAGITVRGTYVAPGKQPPEGERKLYLAIESTNEMAVSKASAEVQRILKEEMMRMATSSAAPGRSGRYKVV